MTHRIYYFRMLPDKVLEATFFGGEIKTFDMKPLISSKGSGFEILSNDEIFENAVIKSSGAEISWTANISIDADQLYSESLFIESVEIPDVRIRLAHILMYARELSHMTQKELGLKVGIDQSDISKIERGVANPSILTLEKLANGMGDIVNFDISSRRGKGADDSVIDLVRPYVNPFKKQGDFTLSDMENFPDEPEFRFELIDGILYKRGVPTTTHQLILGTFYSQFYNYIEANNGSCMPLINPGVMHSIDDESNYLVPDLAILCSRDKLSKIAIIGGPDFVLEVVSESNRIRDYGVKRQKYFELGVREYWILDPGTKVVMINKLSDDNKYEYDNEIHPLGGLLEASIYDGNLLIDLGKIARIINEAPNN